MIVMIGGVDTYVKVKPAPPERDIERQKKQDEEALREAGIDTSGIGQAQKTGDSEDIRFRRYYEAKMREQASEDYWSKVGLRQRDFGGYEPVVADTDADISVQISGCSYAVAKRLGESHVADTVFLSVVGGDALGLAVRCELERADVDISAVKTLEGATPVAVEIHNIIGDLEFCRENNVLMNAITPKFIDENAKVLDIADALFLDGTIPVETMEYISKKYGSRCSIFFDPASVKGGMKFAESNMKASCILPGRMEAEAMSGLQILGTDQLMAAGQFFEERGVEKTIITLKGGGVYYKEGSKSGIIKPDRVLSFADTTGAGDALAAGVLIGSIQGQPLEEAAKMGMTAAAEYLKDVDDVRPY